MSDRTDTTGQGDAARAVVPLVYNGTLIHERHEMLSLADMWRAAGSPDGRRPANWARKEGAEFISFIAETLNVPRGHIYKGERGAGGGTWAHWQVGMAYAKYLDPKFHAWCNEVVRRHMEGAPPQLPAGLTSDDRAAIGGIIKGILARQLQELVPALVREQVASNHHAIVQGVSAGQVLEMAGIEKRKCVRGMARWVSSRLYRFHASKGVAVRLASLGSRTAYVYDILTSREWLAEGGQAEIDQKLAERRGQGKLHLVAP